MTKESQGGLEPPGDGRSIIAISCMHLGGQEDHETSLSVCRFLDHLSRGPIMVEIPGCSPGESKADTNSTTRFLYPPDKIILLGDNQDLWDPWNQDRNRSHLDAIFPLMKMQKMDCNVIWVTGNHDEDTAELIESADQLVKDRKKGRPKEGNKPGCHDFDFEIIYGEDEIRGKKPASLKFPWGKSPEGETRMFEICSRHYPEPSANDAVKGNGSEGLKVGKYRYAFLHGQQFDKWQITHKISKALGTRFDPVDFFEDLANISVTKRMKYSHGLNFLLFAFLLVLLVRPGSIQTIPFVGDSGQVILLIGALCSLGLIIMSVSGIFLFGYPFWKLFRKLKKDKDRAGKEDQKAATEQVKIKEHTVPTDQTRESTGEEKAISPLLAWVSAFASVLFIGIFLSGLSGNTDVFWYLFLILFAISLYILAVMTLPTAIAWAKRNVIYKFIISAKEMSAIEVEEERFNREDFSYIADVVVFGHTHRADFAVVKWDDTQKRGIIDSIERFFMGGFSKGGEKDDIILVNAGSWVFKDKNLANKDFDTFVYIDTHGFCLLRWNNADDKIECFCREKGGKKVPVCNYILKQYQAPDRSVNP